MAEGKLTIGKWTVPLASCDPPVESLESDTVTGSRFSLTVWPVTQPPFRIDEQVTLTILAKGRRFSLKAKHSARNNAGDRMFLAFERS